MDQQAAVRVFTEIFLADLELDRVRSLDEYRALFPGHADSISTKFERLTMDHATPRAFDAASDGGVFIGRYRLEKLLGRGGQGEVHLAFDANLKRHVALKTLHAFDSDDARRALLREASIIAGLDHPNLCAVHEVGSADGIDFVAMRYVKGQSLAQHLEALRALPAAERDALLKNWRTAVEWVETCARALHAAHATGLVHRDVKPGNILLSEEGAPVIVDFGLARQQQSDVLTTIGRTVGTPAYMAPELVRGERTLDRRIDVWALGVILYELLTLRRPFVAPTREGVWRAILETTPADPRTHVPSLPHALCDVVAVALSPEPDRRYATALDLAADLRRVLDGEPIRAKPPNVLGRMTLFVQRNPVVSALASSLIVTLASALVYVGATNRDLRERKRESEEATATATRALAEARWRADRGFAADLVERAKEAYPVHPRMIPRWESWIRDVEALERRLQTYRTEYAAPSPRALPPRTPAWEAARASDLAQLAELEQKHRALELSFPKFGPHPNEINIVSRMIASAAEDVERMRLRMENEPYFADPADTLSRAELGDLIGRIESLATSGLADIRRRIELSRTIEHESLERHAQAWSATIAAIEGDPVYAGLSLRPQYGLVPLGPDPSSGLQEFVDLFTHAPDTPIPSRDANGVLAMTVDCGAVLVLLPASASTLGSTPEQIERVANGASAFKLRESPTFVAELDPYFIGKYEVSQAQYARLVPAHRNGYVRSGEYGVDETHPAELMTWDQAREALHRAGLELPTEAQWEHAARAGTDSIWWTGDDYRELADAVNWADRTAARRGVAVAAASLWPDLEDGGAVHLCVWTKRPSPFGLHHIYGNVSEWTLDVLGDYRFPRRPGTGERYGSHADKRVARGGSFEESWPESRSAFRLFVRPDLASGGVGIRAARALDP
jgi:serine/threonine protein kinase/formylglycine-generating enzyme required for sulfatase activity